MESLSECDGASCLLTEVFDATDVFGEEGLFDEQGSMGFQGSSELLGHRLVDAAVEIHSSVHTEASNGLQSLDSGIQG